MVWYKHNRGNLKCQLHSITKFLLINTTNLRRNQRSEPSLQHETATKAISSPRHVVNPTPVPFTQRPIPHGQFGEPFGREKYLIVTTTKYLKLARLLKTLEHLHRHSPSFVPLQAVQIQPQYQDRRARRVQSER